jgi:hypothetical protein
MYLLQVYVCHPVKGRICRFVACTDINVKPLVIEGLFFTAYETSRLHR